MKNTKFQTENQDSTPLQVKNINPGQSFNLIVQFSQTVNQINQIRIQLGISDEDLANHLGICMNTYRAHKRRGFKNFTVEQIIFTLSYFSSQERTDQTNHRIQRHHRNHGLIEAIDNGVIN